MAMADYRLCDVCGTKAFYDAALNYAHPGDWNYQAGQAPPRCASGDEHPQLDYLGDWGVLCITCAKTHRVVIQPIEEPRDER